MKKALLVGINDYPGTSNDLAGCVNDTVNLRSLLMKEFGFDASGIRVITDKRATLPVTYTGVLPDLFREGQGVVAEGTLAADGTFQADNVLAKHDEKYMPPEVAKKLKEQGVWRGDAQAGAPSAPGKVN